MHNLSEKILQGDPDAFAVMVHKYGGTVFGVCLGLTNDFHLSEDLAQETFMRAFVYLKNLRRASSLRHWLMTIARNLVKDRRKKRQLRMQALSGKDVVPDKAAIDLKSESGSNVEKVQQAMAMLPEGERLVTVLFYIEDQKQQAIAEILGITVSAVKNRLFHARKKLKGELLNMIPQTLNQKMPASQFTFNVVFRLSAFKPILENAIRFAAEEGSASLKPEHLIYASRFSIVSILNNRYGGEEAQKRSAALEKAVREETAKGGGQKYFNWNISEPADQVIGKAFEIGLAENKRPDLCVVVALLQVKDQLPENIREQLAFTAEDIDKLLASMQGRMEAFKKSFDEDDFMKRLEALTAGLEKDDEWQSLENNLKDDIRLFFSSFNLYTNSGFPLVQGIQWAMERLQTDACKSSVASTIRDIYNGSTLGGSPSLGAMLPGKIIAAIKMGEEEGALDTVLEKLAGIDK
ncbi:sigma-70 family RNA polymerase sigma factor [Planctomycetota bacterium]